MTRNEALKQLILGLVYPAVLGTVLYAVLGAALDPVLTIVVGRSAVATATWLKWTLLLTTVAFYCCDYLYIMFTREFRPAFFLCDLILLAGLLITFLTIDITTPALPHRNVIVVAWCYVGFMLLYLCWDSFERFRTQDTAEQRLYNKVITWELVSLVILFAWLGFERCLTNESYRGAVLAAVLLLITIWFAVLALEKRVFYRPPGQAA